MKEPEAFRYMEYLAPSKTLYIRHSVILNDGNKTIAAFFNNMVDYIDKNDVQKLILDVRMNGGGNNQLNKAGCGAWVPLSLFLEEVIC